VAKPYARVVPATTQVLVRTDAGAAAVNDEAAAGDGGAAGGGGGCGARRLTRSKHALGALPPAASPRRKRSRCAPPGCMFPPLGRAHPLYAGSVSADKARLGLRMFQHVRLCNAAGCPAPGAKPLSVGQLLAASANPHLCQVQMRTDA